MRDTRKPAPSRLSRLGLAAGALAAAAFGAAAQGGSLDAGAPAGRSAAQVYQAACAACHGNDGRGVARSVVGFDVPLPDFTDCSFATPEPDSDWLAVTHGGGPERAFDRRMPGFGEALTLDEIQLAIDHARRFCTNRVWPRGELNLPRALVTEKAFPENEAVLTVGAADGEVGNELLYERRLGARSQVEVAVPIDFVRDAGGDWQKGLGDAAIALKRVLFHGLDSGSILSVAGEVVFATGKEDLGLGKDVTRFEPFLAFGQILPADGFVQVQIGAELPFDRDVADNEAFGRLAIGKSFSQGRWGRTWSPMVELLAARELVSGETTQWDLVPQVQVTLSRRQHIMANLGVRLPLNERDGRDEQFLVYLLWDWADGGLFDGW
jgi:hypothetical protein